MAHDHHAHDHHHAPTQLSRAFGVGIVLNLIFVTVEAFAGFWAGSLALLTDAGHNLIDVGSLALAWLALHLARIKPSPQFSYGYRKTTVLASLTNALLLMVAVGGIGFEAVRRLSNPPEVPGLLVAAVAGVGMVVNGVSAWLFHHEHQDDLNVKGAYLHLLADAAVSGAVVIGGLLLNWTHWRWIDPVISFLILAFILGSTWGLLRDSVRLSLDGVPPRIDPEQVRQKALQLNGVRDLRHVHIWALSTTENALTGHLVLDEHLNPAQVQHIKHKFRHQLEHLNISHATLETEWTTEVNLDCACTREVV